MEQEKLEERIKVLTNNLAQKTGSLEALIEIAGQEKKALAQRNVRKFHELLKSKQTMVEDMATLEEEISELFSLAQEKTLGLSEETKQGFITVIEKVDSLFRRWGELEKANMEYAQTYRVSLENEIGQVKKVKNVVDVYRKQTPSRQAKRFDQEV